MCGADLYETINFEDGALKKTYEGKRCNRGMAWFGCMVVRNGKPSSRKRLLLYSGSTLLLIADIGSEASCKLLYLFHIVLRFDLLQRNIIEQSFVIRLVLFKSDTAATSCRVYTSIRT
jgi:hypothetical protein